MVHIRSRRPTIIPITLRKAHLHIRSVSPSIYQRAARVLESSPAFRRWRRVSQWNGKLAYLLGGYPYLELHTSRSVEAGCE